MDIIGNTTLFVASQTSDNSSWRDCQIEFSAVSNSSSFCQLEMDFPNEDSLIAGSGTQLNIWEVEGGMSTATVEEVASTPATLFGTAVLPQKSDMPSRILINSVTCKPVLSYRVNIASDNANVTVQFDQTNAGFRMTQC
ncbi:MAG: hypothetical protein M1827_007133 [Pycnora praestabilis]|nr:MAG: hypothetical protein M1827_007133 [Pycnora praestabilis]